MASSLTGPNYFVYVPQDITQETFSYLDPKDLIGLPHVCKQFNTVLSNEFFKKYCLERFPFLKSITPFCEPLVETAKEPWKLISFTLGSDTVNDQFYTVAEKVISTSEEKFRSCFWKERGLFQSHLDKSNEVLKAICGSYYQDPNSAIDKAWKEYEQNWTKDDETEFNAIMENIQSNPVKFQYWLEKMQELGRSFEESMLKIQDDLKKLDETEFLSTMHEKTQGFFQTLINNKVDETIIKLCQLAFKKMVFSIKFQNLESTREEIERARPILTSTIDCFDKVGNSQSHKKYATQIVYHILYLLPHLHKWIEHLPTIGIIQQNIEICMNTTSREKFIISIRDAINSLPKDASTFIWRELYFLCAHGAQEDQWSEKHFHENLSEVRKVLSWLVNRIDGKDINSFTVGSTLDCITLTRSPIRIVEFLKSFIDTGRTIGFFYPQSNPKKDIEFTSPQEFAAWNIS